MFFILKFVKIFFSNLMSVLESQSRLNYFRLWRLRISRFKNTQTALNVLHDIQNQSKGTPWALDWRGDVEGGCALYMRRGLWQLYSSRLSSSWKSSCEQIPIRTYKSRSSRRPRSTSPSPRYLGTPVN